MLNQRLPVLLVFLLACGCLAAQPSSAALLHYNTDQGLSNDHITAIAKDKLGFLWVGTVNGLNRFDGRNFKVFQHSAKDENSIPNNQIIGITLAPDGWLWVATDFGLCKIDPFWLDIERIPIPENADTLKNDAATPVAFDSKGMAWTTGWSGIYQFDPKTDKIVFSHKTTQNLPGYFGTIIDEKDRIWMINSGLRRFDPVTKELKLFKGVNPRESFLDASSLCVVQDDAGQIWAGTWFSGIWKYLPELDEFAKTKFPNTLAQRLLPGSTADGRQFFWVGGGNHGLGIYYPDNHQHIEFKPDMRDPYTHNNYLVKVFFKDPANDDVWIGTEIGLEHYAPSAVRFGRGLIPQTPDMGQFSLVSGVVHDNTDPTGQRYFVAVWGTGLFSWNKTTGEVIRMKSDKSNFAGRGIYHLFQDSKGFIWSCTNAGVSRYNPRTGEARDYEKFFQKPDQYGLVWCGMEDSKGNVLFGTALEGLYRYNPKADRMELFFNQKEFFNKRGYLGIRQMSEAPDGRLWLACGESSLIRFDPATGEGKRFTYQNQFTTDACGAVEAGQNGRVYAAFHETFLELDSEGKVLHRFTNENGLKTTRLCFFVEDKKGRIWFNSEYLLHCFDPESSKFSYYGKADGLFSNSITDALNITPAGEVFVGFQNAFNYFYPDRMTLNHQPPPVVVTGINVMNKERELRTQTSITLDLGLFTTEMKSVIRDTFLVLNPGEDFFEVEFAALNFNQPERNRYAYMLEGFHDDWVYTDRPVATFTNLNGGTYLLRMKAANNDGVWNEQGTSLEIRVRPPFHKTWWFQVLMMLLVGGVVLGFVKFRRQQRARLERFREGLARDLHDEMGSTLSSIRFFSEFAKQQVGDEKPTVTPVLQRISDSANSLSESMQDIIWAMKTKNDHLEDLAARMTEFGLRLLEARNMRFTTHVNEDFSGKQLKPEQRRNVYLIFKEAVNNAAKYAEASEVQLFLSLKNGLLQMKITDNGKGFEVGDGRSTLGTGGSSGGNGLNNMRQRAADIGGNVEFFSKPGEGTRVELRVRV